MRAACAKLPIDMVVDTKAMRDRIAALEARVSRLESELAAVLAQLPPSASAAGRASKGPPAVPRVGLGSKRPPLGPPPLPSGKSVVPRAVSRKTSTDIDISEIAELVDSVPPPPRAPRK